MPNDSIHRYLLALPRGGGRVFLAWRLLASDRPGEAFAVQRRRAGGAGWEAASALPVVSSTTFLDVEAGAGEVRYRVVDEEGRPSEEVTVDAGAPASLLARDVALDPECEVQGLIVGDLENDGRLGYVLKQARGGTIRLAAYAHDGRPLWEHDTHLPTRGGWDGSMLHCPFLAWDLNGDGRCEVAFHAYTGRYPREDYTTALEGETLTVVDGETGDLVWEAPWPAVQSRVMMTAGHLQGFDAPASVVVQDETYGPVALTAIEGRRGAVAWRVVQERPGGHNLDIADIDGDGRQEVICGGICYDGDGRARWEAEPFGHTDISKPARIDPALPGMQIWYAVETANPGVYLVDCRGRTLFSEPFRHAHYGWVARHTVAVPGLQPHTAEDNRRGQAGDTGEHFPIYLPDGSWWLNLSDWQRKNLVPVHWGEEPTVSFIIRKENKRVVRLLSSGEIQDVAEGRLPEGGVYGRNVACVDVVGDYRENIVTVDEERHRLIVLANPTVAAQRGYSPYDDLEYRHDRSQLGSGYYIYLSPPDTRVR